MTKHSIFSARSGNVQTFDALARAMRQAVTRTVRVTALKGNPSMAKTLRSRIAAVAVVAVGAGLLVATPASATATTRFSFMTAESISTDKDAAVQIAGASNFVELASKADATSGSTVRVDVSGAGATFKDITEAVGTIAAESDSTAAATVSYNTAATSATFSTYNIYESASKYLKLQVNTPNVGTVTVKVYEITGPTAGVYTETLKDTLTVTVNAAATAGTLSTANSTSVISKGDTYAPATAGVDDVVIADGITVGQARATVKITLLDVNGNAMPDTTTVGATVAGPGQVDLNTNAGSAAYGTSGRVRSATTSSGVLYAKIYSDGTAGVSTVTFTVGSTTIATETVTFYGKVATLTATQVKYSVSDSAGPTAYVKLTAKDSNGVAVPIRAADGAPVETAAALAVTAIADADNADSASAVDLLITPTATKTGTKTVTWKHTGTGVTVSTSVVVAGLADSAVVTTDKATYAPGETIKVTVTAKDASGFIAAGGTSSAIAVTTSTFQNATLPTTLSFSNGAATFSIYAPGTTGNFTIDVKFSAGASWSDNLDDVTKSVTVKVAEDTAAIDAAKAAADAAKAEAAKATAAVAALSATIASIQAGISNLVASTTATLTVLAAQISKIMKKLGIK